MLAHWQTFDIFTFLANMWLWAFMFASVFYQDILRFTEQILIKFAEGTH